MNKIIWTIKELEEAMRIAFDLQIPFPVLPLGHITTEPQSRAEATEISQVAGTITNVVVYLPPGVRDLVWASVLLNGSSLLRAVGGDNQYHSFLVANGIVKGDTILVIVKNYDAEFSHTIGVRVEVKENA